MQRQRATVTGPAGDIDVRIEVAAPSPDFVAVIGHPHPLFGGTMDNKVITSLARLVRDNNGVAIRFNFRGVGDSAGVHDHGVGEVDDMQAVIDYAEQAYAGLPLWLAGFSFGSYVAACVAVKRHQQGKANAGLLLVGPPVHNYDFTAISSVGAPVAVIQGDEDEVVPADQVFDWASASPLEPVVERMSGASHFFHGCLPELQSIAAMHLPNRREE